MSPSNAAFVMLICAVPAAGTAVTPVQKVVQLLNDMVAQGVKAKQDEEVQFAAYGSFCSSTMKEKKRLIKKGNELIETLEADIQKHESDAALLAKEISGLDVDISTWEGDTKAASRVRQIEIRDYENTHKDYTESMEALEEGIQTLEKENQDVSQSEEEAPAPTSAAAAALNQLRAQTLIPTAAKKAIAAFLSVTGPDEADEAENLAVISSEENAHVFNENAALLRDAVMSHDLRASDRVEHTAKAALLQMTSSNLLPAAARRALNNFAAVKFGDDENLAVEQPEAPMVEQKKANAYEAQSQGVIDMLTKLNEKFFQERETLEKTEVDARHAFNMLQQDLKTQIKGATEAREEKKEAKSKALQAAADAKGDLQNTVTTRDDDMKYLADLTASCEQKATAFESRQKLRAEELEAIKKAIEILTSDAVSGASEKHLPQLVQLRKSRTSLAQLRSSTHNPAQQKVAQYLKSQGARLHSRVLSAIATRVADDPFKKVKKMVKDLIVKLMEQANEEADHKGWCDMELGTNERTREEKTRGVEVLTAEIDELQASVAKLAEDITAISSDIAELDANVAKATAQREKENKENLQTIKDAQEAQTAVDSALDTLKDFYDKASGATALVQQKHKQAQPEVFDEPYKGMGGENGGVIGMLEVIDADFQHLESETKSQEAEAAKEYGEFMDDSNVNKAQKTKDLEHKNANKQDQEQALQEKKKDLAGTNKELNAANAYFDKLKGTCIAEPESYEDRVARRKEEIESLQEALRILQGEEVV